jgi:hypothetical protein
MVLYLSWDLYLTSLLGAFAGQPFLLGGQDGPALLSEEG